MKIRLIEKGDTIFETRKGEITEIPGERLWLLFNN